MKKDKPYAQKIIPLIIIAVTVYTILAFILQFVKGVEASSTLTISYFTFWGTELVNLAVIKTTKTKKEGNENDC